MSKQPLQTECHAALGKALLRLLELRFEAEPLFHYALAAVIISAELNEPIPAFAHGWLHWFASRTLLEEWRDEIETQKRRKYPPGVHTVASREQRRGEFPELTSDRDKLGHKWARYEDCHELLEAWLSHDQATIDEAFAKQARRRQEFVKEVRDRLAAGDRREDVFGSYELDKDGKEVGVSARTFERRFKRLTELSQPPALIRDGDGFALWVNGEVIDLEAPR